MVAEDLSRIKYEDVVKVIVQNDIFDVFTQSKICFRFDLATATLLREIDVAVEGMGDVIRDVIYFEDVDNYVIITDKAFAVGDFVYGLRLIDEVIHTIDIRDNYLAFATHEGIGIYTFPDLKHQKSILLQGIKSFCFVNEDREIVVVTDEGNYIMASETLIMQPLKSLPTAYNELRYKKDYILGIKKNGIDFIEEDLLAVSSEYPSIQLPDKKITAVKLCDDDIYIIVGGSEGGVEIFNLETNELFYKGSMVPGCAIQTIHMDMEYQLVLIYTKEKGIELHPFVDFV